MISLGAVVLAIASQCTIVPIICTGMREALPTGSWRVKSPSHVQIDFLHPLETKGIRTPYTCCLNCLRKFIDRLHMLQIGI